MGNHNTEALLGLVVLPELLWLAVGVLLTTAGGLRGLWRGKGLAVSLYLLPYTVVFAAHCYQLWGHRLWVLRLPPSPTPQQQPHALTSIFLLRSLLSLVVGTIVSFWIICLPKSVHLQSWKSVLCPASNDTYKSPTATSVRPMIKCQNGLYYSYKHPKVNRIHRKHKGKNGDETLV